MAERPGISLPEWYEIVKDLVDTPLTVILPWQELSSESPTRAFAEPALRLAAMGRLVGIGFPAFLRTGYTSGKHGWNETCRVPGPNELPSHMRAICEYSELADIIGLPTDTWVLRELLSTRAAFHAFRGQMPITMERRFFFADGKVVGHHPYWPPLAIEEPSTPDWPELLEVLNHDARGETAELTVLTEKVAAAIPGAWSVDWLYVPSQGWVLTDMAWAEVSYVWWDHPDAPPRGAWEGGEI